MEITLLIMRTNNSNRWVGETTSVSVRIAGDKHVAKTVDDLPATHGRQLRTAVSAPLVDLGPGTVVRSGASLCRCAMRPLFERFKLFALCTKHYGFSEEKEWRAVYMPDAQPGKDEAAAARWANEGGTRRLQYSGRSLS
jgi:hypothetical protein